MHKIDLDKLSFLTRTDDLATAMPARRRAALIAEGLHAAWELAHECRATGRYAADCYPGIVLAVAEALRRPEVRRCRLNPVEPRGESAFSA
jgi:hypothetical protein